MRSSFAISAIGHLLALGLVVIPAISNRTSFQHKVLTVNLVTVRDQKPSYEAPKIRKSQDSPKPKTEPKKTKMKYKPKKKIRKKTAKKARVKTSKKDGGTRKAKPRIKVDSEDFRFAYYLEIIRDKVSTNWSPPPTRGKDVITCATIYFRVTRGGRITDIKVEKTSGFGLFDRSAIRAVTLSDPLPPLPAGFRGKYLGVHLEFEKKSD